MLWIRSSALKCNSAFFTSSHVLLSTLTRKSTKRCKLSCRSSLSAAWLQEHAESLSHTWESTLPSSRLSSGHDRQNKLEFIKLTDNFTCVDVLRLHSLSLTPRGVRPHRAQHPIGNPGSVERGEAAEETSADQSQSGSGGENRRRARLATGPPAWRRPSRSRRDRRTRRPRLDQGDRIFRAAVPCPVADTSQAPRPARPRPACRPAPCPCPSPWSRGRAGTPPGGWVRVFDFHPRLVLGVYWLRVSGRGATAMGHNAHGMASTLSAPRAPLPGPPSTAGRLRGRSRAAGRTSGPELAL